MICRLCLARSESLVPIFIDETKAIDATIAQFVGNFFEIELQHDDPVSTSICATCMKQLVDFYEFQLMIKEKQQSLLIKNEEKGLIESCSINAPELHLMAMPEADVLNCSDMTTDETKDGFLCEPIIDATMHKQSDGDICDNAVESELEFKSVADQDKFLHEITKLENRQRNKPKTEGIKVPAKSLRTNLTTKSLDKEKITKKLKKVSKARLLSIRIRNLETKGIKRGRSKQDPVTNKEPHGSTSEESRAELEKRKALTSQMDEYIKANVKLDCCICLEPLNNFDDLKRHFRVQHNCSGYVKCCNNRYNKRKLYYEHLKLHKDPDYFKCKICSKKLVNRCSFEMHCLRFHSEDQERIYECSICQKRFAKIFLLNMHKKSHKSTERNEQCEICDKAFRTPLEVKAHIKRVHDATFTPVICDICGATFRSHANFVIHKESLHREGPPQPEVQCHVCSRWMRNERSLRKHIARHSDNNVIHKCELCDVVKSTRTALVSHMRYHHSDKSFKCSVCDKEFKLQRALKEHMATHTGVDIYKCDFCTRTFKSYANMHNHKKKMHPNDWVRKYSQPSKLTTSVLEQEIVESVQVKTDIPETMQELKNCVTDCIQTTVE